MPEDTYNFSYVRDSKYGGPGLPGEAAAPQTGVLARPLTQTVRERAHPVRRVKRAVSVQGRGTDSCDKVRECSRCVRCALLMGGLGTRLCSSCALASSNVCGAGSRPVQAAEGEAGEGVYRKAIEPVHHPTKAGNTAADPRHG